jgi:glycosyltransferase involved in cell wall biosynthesis
MGAHLLMIGERVGASDPTNFAYLQEVEAQIGALGLEQQVAWTGRLDDEAVSEALAVCDLLLMPYSDGVSLRRGTLMAGLAHGCAIVTTEPQAPLPELVDGTHLLTVPPDNPGAAANAVRRIVDDPALAARLRQNARAVSERFSWQTIARQHLEFYARDA